MVLRFFLGDMDFLICVKWKLSLIENLPFSFLFFLVSFCFYLGEYLFEHWWVTFNGENCFHYTKAFYYYFANTLHVYINFAWKKIEVERSSTRWDIFGFEGEWNHDLENFYKYQSKVGKSTFSGQFFKFYTFL